MKVLIAGTPLESLMWQRELGKVRFVFRRDTTLNDQKEFLRDLGESVSQETARVIDEKWIRDTAA
ncbi:hypothetical protein NKK48_01330 [Mesorhizobium sp. C386A]|uniref:hypothetical protein n=1 Tax=unclassified Mesorhizobium TaxID=325217 RepID=UPI0003CDEFE6|nr:hypothetical protein [Mesorhizobium sp. LNJC386A00]ESY35724.1 hypothetical protein X748_14000 [Mesorhizobium sp. LNJC386A00]